MAEVGRSAGVAKAKYETTPRGYSRGFAAESGYNSATMAYKADSEFSHIYSRTTLVDSPYTFAKGETVCLQNELYIERTLTPNKSPKAHSWNNSEEACSPAYSLLSTKDDTPNVTPRGKTDTTFTRPTADVCSETYLRYTLATLLSLGDSVGFDL